MRLGGEDTAWLRMDDETNPMVVNSLVELGGTLDAARVWSIVEARGLPPRFRSRLVESRHAIRTPRLEIDPSFEIERHLRHVEIEPGDDALRAFVSREVGRRLDFDRPLWRTFVIDREGGSTAILFRVHHSLADGFALLRQLLGLCDERDLPEAPIATHGTRRTGVLGGGVSLARIVALPPDPRTTLKRSLGTEKRVAWSRAVSLATVKAAAHARGATVNDVLVAAVAGALGRHLRSRGEPVEEIRAMVPVNLREHAATELGNRFGLVILALPVGVLDAGARLEEVKRRMNRLKSTPEAVVAMGLLGVLGHLPHRLEDLGSRFFANKASLVLTNVPGPREKLHLGGVPIERIVFWVPEAARLGLGVSIFSYAGAVTVGVIADARVAHDPEAIVAGLEAELEAFGAARPPEARAS